MNQPAKMPGPAPRGRPFTGYPYLATRIVSSLHHILLLPRSWTLEQLGFFSRDQTLLNRLPNCLVFNEGVCLYLEPDGSARVSNTAPWATTLVSGRLAPVRPIRRSKELMVRRMNLVLIEEQQHRQQGTLIMMGDLSKGGRPPTPDEQERLTGNTDDGIPFGLLPCMDCSEWRGDCFDTLGTGLIVRVHCSCENDNRCAVCGEPLFRRKLNANYFDPADCKVWHVAAFPGLDHICEPEPG